MYLTVDISGIGYLALFCAVVLFISVPVAKGLHRIIYGPENPKEQ